MKKLTYLLIAVAAIAFSFTTLSNNPTTKKLDVKDFTGIKVNGNYQVFLKQGNTYSVKVEGDEETIKKLSTSVKDDIWAIQSKSNGNKSSCSNYSYNQYNSSPMKVYITMPTLKQLTLTSSGKVVTQSNFKVNNLDLSISGSGKMRLDLNATSIESNICGSGKVVLKGIAKHLDATVTGSGDVDAEDMKVENVHVSVSGSGDINVHATEYLKAEVTGSGDILYKGSPNVHKKITGGGSVSKL